MPSHRHRHFVALPLASGALLLVLAVHTLMAGTFRVGADSVALVTGEKEQTVDLGWFLTVRLGTDSTARADKNGTTIALQKGEVMLHARGYVKVDAGQRVTAHVLGGAAAILRSDGSTTLVALSVPMIVESAKGKTLLPTGHQMTVTQGTVSSSVTPIAWVHSRMQAVSPSRSSTIAAIDSKDPNDAIAHFFAATSAATAEDITNAEETLVGLSGRTDLRPLLTLALLQSGRPIAKEAEENIRQTLIASADLRTGVPLALVQIARSSSRPLSASLIDFWSQELSRIASVDLAVALQTLEFGADASARFATLGFPLSAEGWAKAVSSASPILRSITKNDAEKTRIEVALTDMNAAKLPSLQASLEPPLEATNEPQAVPALSPDEALRRTQAMLFTREVLRGAMMRLSMNEKNPSLVDVTGVFKEVNGQLLSISFSYNPKTSQLSSIREGERPESPNKVSSEEYFR